jgi:hypothetical protein
MQLDFVELITERRGLFYHRQHWTARLTVGFARGPRENVTLQIEVFGKKLGRLKALATFNRLRAQKSALQKFAEVRKKSCFARNALSGVNRRTPMLL